jgi:pimeloyl-ACP methyl ester carboxylesterase
MTPPTRIALTAAAISLAGVAVVAIAVPQLPAIGAGALLYPMRRPSTTATPDGCVKRTFAGVEMRLSGWHCRADAPAKVTIVYLHGVAANKDSGEGVVNRFRGRGFDVIVYDSRAHGESEGDRCTYGYFEKQDLQRVLDESRSENVVLIGHSLGGAVALQAAAVDRRVRAVVAASSFSDLRTIATERAPFVFVGSVLDAAFERVARDGRFTVDQVSPVAVAPAITVPVLLIHGELDAETPPAHSQRIYAALAGPKRLLILPNTGHNDALNGQAWSAIEQWLAEIVR